MFPAGTKVERADPRCTGFMPNEYICRPSAATLPARASMLFSFTVRGSGKHAGSVQLSSDGSGLETKADLANNTAKIVLTAAGKPAVLPITGPGGSLALGLVLLGGGALLTGRTRK